jgi:cell division protein ZipA
MDSSTLRWVLIVIGLVIIGLVFIFGNPERKKGPRASRRTSKRTSGREARAQDRAEAVRREPTIGPVAGEGDAGAGSDGSPTIGDQGELEIDGELRMREPGMRDTGLREPRLRDTGLREPRLREPHVHEPDRPRRPPMPDPDRIVSLFLVARDNHVITGAQLLEAAVKTGMDFGEMNIFHRITEGESRPVFSLANAAKPGHFDRMAWHEFETGALVLFTTLPNPMSALDAWDSMLATARRMGEILNADLQDEKHHPFTRRREAQMREEMRDYERKRVTARR